LGFLVIIGVYCPLKLFIFVGAERRNVADEYELASVRAVEWSTVAMRQRFAPGEKRALKTAE